MKRQTLCERIEDMLNIDINIVWSILNVLIVFGILYRFLFKPVNRILDARKAEIAGKYAEADAMKKDAQDMKEKCQAVMANIDEEKRKAMNESRVKASEEYDRIVETAKIKADAVLSEAKDKAKREQERHLQQAQGQIADMVLEATAKLVASQNGEEQDRELYQLFMDRTGKKQDQ